MNLAIFDVDGTLTETNSIDGICFVQAFADAHAITEINTNWIDYPYVTDSGIMFQIFAERLGRPPDDAELQSYKACLRNLLETHWSRDSSLFAEVSGASCTLTRLTQEKDWAVALATGCWRVSAELKLRAAGIQTEHLPAAFAEDGLSREAILQTAVSRARLLYKQKGFAKIVSVGDAVWDVQAARALGMAFVGVGKGDRELRLRRAGATHVLEDYSDYGQLIVCLKEAEVPSQPQ
ncbi:MAG TPA: haloacid dehalogenase-like hydrolase [Pyrinomonadaceae bacterium]|nr:haloacid dehalogenase-like hydrolase [Pyrinomonadaceae bacterium]